ncbi:MAG TPA: hypothetical protein VK698_38635 [Kofleriaceae bacterium]|nr:hypothetical protein [Kofleriaceae bacterium]
MADKRKQTTSLWSVIEKMQSRLEAEGMDRDVVDAAVTTGLQALLDFAPPVRTSSERVNGERPGKKLPVRLALWTRAAKA